MTAAQARYDEPSAVRLRPGVPPAPVPYRPPGGRRRDIEGLRAVAVLLVVLDHAGVPVLSGGYVGVDVFFVISGFLITSMLVGEASLTGTVALGRFWSRRAARLIPVASLVLTATLIGSWLWLSPVRVAGYAADALAAACQAVNIRLAIEGTDYFATTAPSPFQHFWSLAVEEQFYLLWPLLVVATFGLARRRALRTRRRALGWLLAVLTVASFVISVLEIRRAAPWAYFGLHSRTWELGVGALLALGAPRLHRLPRLAAGVLGRVGLLAVLTAAIAYDDSTAFPGVAATLPVAGAALIIAAGCAYPQVGVGRLLGVPPAQLLGRLSYGWYLWHWPVLLIAPLIWPWRTGVGVNLGWCAVALVLAAVSYYLVENPVRRARALVGDPHRGVLLGVALSSSTAVLAVVVGAWPPVVPMHQPAVDTAALVAAAADPRAALADLVASAAQARTLPANLTPALADAAADENRAQRDGCHVSLTSTESTSSCAYGRPNARRTVVLLGDSHALQWFPTLEALAGRHGWRLISLTRSACSPADIIVTNARLKRVYDECGTWRAGALQRIRDLSPWLVVVSSSMNYRDSLAGDVADPDAAWRDGWGRTLGVLHAAAKRVVLIGDTPFLRADPVDCLALRAGAVDGCADAVTEVVRDADWRAIADAAAGAVGAPVVDPLPWLCGQRCPLVVGNVLVYRDSNHLSTAYATLLAPVLDLSLPRG